MATFGWSYKNNVSGVKRPKELKRKVEEWQKDREDVKIPLHSQTHSAESINAGMKRRRYHPRAKIFVGNLNRDTKPVTLAEYFSFFGEIAYLKIVKDRDTGISRGFAFITFVEVDKAEKAVRWCRGNHSRIDDKEIKVGSAERRQRPVARHQQGLILSGNTDQKERRESHTLYWEYKWTQDHESEVYGPYETGLMLQWFKMGYFSSGCWVRQTQGITGGHEQKVQGIQDEETNENIPKLASLVDSYSSSSEDEESPTKRTKIDSPSQQADNSSDEDEQQNKKWEYENQDGKRINKKQEENNEMGYGNVVNEDSTVINQQDDENQHNTPKDESINANQNLETEGKTLSKEYNESDNENNDSVNQERVADPTNSWYQADRGGCKARDIFGRDSSSEDEDYDYNDLDQQLTQNEFVHINEIDFSMFP